LEGEVFFLLVFCLFFPSFLHFFLPSFLPSRFGCELHLHVEFYG
jgi:hypothetical protein